METHPSVSHHDVAYPRCLRIKQRRSTTPYMLSRKPLLLVKLDTSLPAALKAFLSSVNDLAVGRRTGSAADRSRDLKASQMRATSSTTRVCARLLHYFNHEFIAFEFCFVIFYQS